MVNSQADMGKAEKWSLGFMTWFEKIINPFFFSMQQLYNFMEAIASPNLCLLLEPCWDVCGSQGPKY